MKNECRVFDASTSYKVGDRFTYNGELYEVVPEDKATMNVNVSPKDGIGCVKRPIEEVEHKNDSNRLTELLSTTCGRTYVPITNDRECCDKLGLLEDIEDELGIELVTLYTALKQKWIYCIYNGKVQPTIAVLEYYRGGWTISGVFGTSYKITDYGKTWALTEDELK